MLTIFGFCFMSAAIEPYDVGVARMENEKILPVGPGDWIESTDYEPKIARVRRAYWGTDWQGVERCHMDIALYGLVGDKVGRTSPPEGGPKSYEPYISYEGWRRIRKPDFPLKLLWLPDGDEISPSARYVTDAVKMPNRTGALAGRKPLRFRPAAKPRPTDFDPELELRSRRMAAQSLRDVQRVSPSDAIKAEIARIEAEADRIAKEHGLER